VVKMGFVPTFVPTLSAFLHSVARWRERTDL